jgi:hypothetical protein
MRRHTWVLIVGGLVAPLACAQEHDASSATPSNAPSTAHASRNPIGQALAELLQQARPAAAHAPTAPSASASPEMATALVATPASDGLADTRKSDTGPVAVH